MTKSKYISLTILLIGLCQLVNAQKTKIFGKITDAVTQEPLPFVSILFKDTKIGTTSNIDGAYTLESYYATDSIVVTFVGYKKRVIKITKDKSQELNIELSEATTELVEFVVNPTDFNPAHPIIRRVLANKDINNREKLDAYQYEVYNKIQLDLNNITDEFKNKKLFKHFDFIFNNIDTTQEKDFLPVFISESISTLFYRKNPHAQKEHIKATNVSGVTNESVSQFTGDMYQQVNIYDNFLHVFGKNFVSPIGNGAFRNYKFYLTDSATMNGYWCYKIEFEPKRIGELTFVGEMWIHDTTYAIKKVSGTIAADANINLVNKLIVTQTFEQVEKEVWMLVKDELLVDFEVGKNQMGFYGRKTTSYRDFVINQAQTDQFYQGFENIIVSDSALKYDDSFWNQNRHDSLSSAESNIFHLHDTLASLPIMKTYVDVIETIATGYKNIGKFKIGPYYSIYSFNQVEGDRFRLGGATNWKFSEKIEFSGYGAFGLKDQEFKYAGGTRFFITKKPWRLMNIVYKNDVEQIGVSSNAYSTSNVVSSFARRNPLNKLVFKKELRIAYEREWFPGFSSNLLFRSGIISPLGITTFDKEQSNGTIIPVNQINSSEISVYSRFAYNEEFLSSGFERVSLGTKYPVFTVQYVYGIPKFIGSEYEFHKIILSLKHKIPMGIFGTFKYTATAGKIIGQLPYPLLEVHAGNETWGYSDYAFNMMNIGEFVSDAYISFNAQQHFDGLLLNKFPLIRKLKWREVATIQGVYGTLSENNLKVMNLPYYTSSLKEKPYLEAALGVENIFMFLRCDVVWRLTYLRHEFNDILVSPIGFRAKLQFDF